MTSESNSWQNACLACTRNVLDPHQKMQNTSPHQTWYEVCHQFDLGSCVLQHRNIPVTVVSQLLGCALDSHQNLHENKIIHWSQKDQTCDQGLWLSKTSMERSKAVIVYLNYYAASIQSIMPNHAVLHFSHILLHRELSADMLGT